MDLSWILLTAFSLLVGVGGVLFTLCTNSVIRARALNSPGSIAYYAIKMIDPLLEATLYRKIRGLSPEKPSARSAKSGPLSQSGGLHEFLKLQDMISVRHSFVASIDIGMKLPHWLTKTVGNPGTAIGLAMAVGYLVLVGAFFSLSRFLHGGAAFLLAIAFAALLGWTMFRFFAGPGSFFEVVQNLHYWPHSIVQMDSVSVTVQSGWSKMITPNTPDLEFAKVSAETSKGLQLNRKGGETVATVFMYHELFEHLIMTESDLDELVNKLNALLAKSKVPAPV